MWRWTTSSPWSWGKWGLQERTPVFERRSSGLFLVGGLKIPTSELSGTQHNSRVSAIKRHRRRGRNKTTSLKELQGQKTMWKTQWESVISDFLHFHFANQTLKSSSTRQIFGFNWFEICPIAHCSMRFHVVSGVDRLCFSTFRLRSCRSRWWVQLPPGGPTGRVRQPPDPPTLSQPGRGAPVFPLCLLCVYWFRLLFLTLNCRFPDGTNKLASITVFF